MSFSRHLIACVCVGAVLLAAPAGGQVDYARKGEVTTAELTPRTEAAIDRALDHLARTQHADGGWNKPGEHYREAITAVPLMAFMVKGNFPKQGKHGKTVEKALDYLLKKAKEGGGYVGDNMYGHALTTLAFSEVWGMTRRDDVRPALKRAVEIILRAQDKSGGWRYRPEPSGADISVTVMQVVALASAKEAGIYVPDKVIENAIKYVKSCNDTASGGFCYGPGGVPGFARTAAGVTSLMMCGQRKSLLVQRGLKYLLDLPDSKFTDIEHYYYGHYYAIQAMYQGGDAYYQKWYPRIRDGLLAKQGADGGWPGGYGSFGTGVSVLILGCPYRFLPIYQR